MNKIACEDCDKNNNLFNDVVNGLTKLIPSTTLAVIDSVQVHSLKVANPEVIKVLL